VSTLYPKFKTCPKFQDIQHVTPNFFFKSQ